MSDVAEVGEGVSAVVAAPPLVFDPAYPTRPFDAETVPDAGASRTAFDAFFCAVNSEFFAFVSDTSCDAMSATVGALRFNVFAAMVELYDAVCDSSARCTDSSDC